MGSFMKNHEDGQHAQQITEIETEARRRERVFEATTLSCGKVQTTESSCAHNRKNS